MHDFNYYRPGTLDEALTLLREHDDATLLAGGMTLLPTLKFRLAQPGALIDLGAIRDLRGIREHRHFIEIGAMTIHADIAASTLIRQRLPALASLVRCVGDPQVRNRGTIGGSVANNDPAADYPAAVLGLNAVVVTDRREITADEFFLGMFETALEEGEILIALRFPVPQRAAYAKFANPASRYAIAGVMVVETGDGEGDSDRVRVAVTGAAPAVFRARDIEAALAKKFSVSSLDGVTIDPDALSSDMHADAQYRAHLVIAMARRAVEEMCD
ncbi:MAG: xanthine dehydrogenase family protein subunit M [Woeseia sp.]